MWRASKILTLWGDKTIAGTAMFVVDCNNHEGGMAKF